MMFLGTMFNTTEVGPFSGLFVGGNTLPVCLYAIGIFGLCCRRKGKMKPAMAKILYVGAESSFCIYLVHVFFISLFVQWGLGPDGINRIFSYPLLTLLGTILSLGVYLILSRIPIVKKWLI